jgi:hypothetical protein
MRIGSILTIIFLILSSVNAFSASDLDTRISEFQKLETRVEKECVKNSQPNKYAIHVERETIKCDELIIITGQLRKEIENEVLELKACEENSDSSHDALASDTQNILNHAPACKPSPDQNKCAAKFTCTILAAAGPVTTLMSGAGKLFNSTVLKDCANTGNDCLLKVAKGIFDSVWSSLHLIWDLGKLALIKTGELLGVVKISEAKTSERAMAAQQVSPSFLKTLKAHPIDAVKMMASQLYESLESAAINHYGCEKWAGTPFRSKCVAPMSTWNCASCAQKAQVWCGIAGYASGEIVTAFLTGGLVAGGKSAIGGAMKLSSLPARNIAEFMGKTFPKTVVAAGKIGTGAKVILTGIEVKSIGAWEKVSNSKTAHVLSIAASKIAASTVGKVTSITVKPIRLYLQAMDNAFKAGYSTVEKTTAKSLQGSKLADEAMGIPSASSLEDAAEIQRLMAKYKTDEEYFKLFLSPKLYDDYHKELVTVIRAMEKEQAHLSKAEIRQNIERMMNSCDL